MTMTLDQQMNRVLGLFAKEYGGGALNFSETTISQLPDAMIVQHEGCLMVRENSERMKKLDFKIGDRVAFNSAAGSDSCGDTVYGTIVFGPRTVSELQCAGHWGGKHQYKVASWHACLIKTDDGKHEQVATCWLRKVVKRTRLIEELA